MSEHTQPSNFTVDVTDIGRDQLRHVFGLLRETGAAGYRVIETGALVFYWQNINGLVVFPFRMQPPAMADFAWYWLEQCLYPKRHHNFDGDINKGWRVCTVDRLPANTTHSNADDFYAIVCVIPVWAEYAK